MGQQVTKRNKRVCMALKFDRKLSSNIPSKTYKNYWKLTWCVLLSFHGFSELLSDLSLTGWCTCSTVLCISVCMKRLCISQFQQCPSPPPPPGCPRELAFFENELANAPPPGQKKLCKCPGVGAQKCFISFVYRLSFNKI